MPVYPFVIKTAKLSYGAQYGRSGQDKMEAFRTGPWLGYKKWRSNSIISVGLHTFAAPNLFIGRFLRPGQWPPGRDPLGKND